ncbi:uncharacterized protein LOC123561326 [Mercenaria mercenaria]|uniref:uncharacterized protein LOC123561326 n=1 Tax=Mercenaria mercenaria TaxID=6596 RepID=UPI00234F1D8E|nr:uncharacterized protein LOC123561326 [Mercenaria mercenaria]
MTGFFKHFGLCAILSSVQVSGTDFTISKDKVVIGNTGTLTLRCDVTENKVKTIYLIQIQRETVPGSGIFESVVQMENVGATSETPTLKVTNNKDFVAGGSLDKTTPGNTYLTVSMNISKLVCNDARSYKCELSYKDTANSIQSVEKNGTFSAYVYPEIRQLEGKRNDIIVQGSSSTDQAAFNVGDELELTCTATIGSLPATTVRWRKTSEMGQTDEFTGYQPQTGSFDEGTAISDNQCGYTRVATIRYNTTKADANRANNLAFECYVAVSGNPYGTTYTTKKNPRFYADVISGIDFSFRNKEVLLGSTGNQTLTCQVNEDGVNLIYNIMMFRETNSGSGMMERFAEINAIRSKNPILTQQIPGFVVGGELDQDNPRNTKLEVYMDVEKLTCSDAREYQCQLTYSQRSTRFSITVESNATFSGYVFPAVKTLEGKKNGFIEQGPSSDYRAAFNVGDVLELTCTANIGSKPATTISWLKTSKMSTSGEFIEFQPQTGSFDEGTAISDNQCGYTRVATIRYNTTKADANRANNLAFECYVSVSGNPYGTTYTTQNNPRFYVDVRDEGISDDKGISDNKVTKRDLTAGAIGGVIVAVVILGVGIIIVIVRRKLTTNEAPRTGVQTENSSSGNYQIQSRTQPEMGQNDQSSIIGMYEHLQNTVEMENKYVYDSLKADSEGSTDSKAQYKKLQQAVCTPPTYTSLRSATLNKDSERAYENL